MPLTPFSNEAVKAAYEAFPNGTRTLLLNLREQIFICAEALETIGTLEETLKWGEPAYLTHNPKSGTTIRLSVAKNGSAAVFTHCQTAVVSDFQALFPDDFAYEGNRGVYVKELSGDAIDKLRLLITSALTYHT